MLCKLETPAFWASILDQVRVELRHATTLARVDKLIAEHARASANLVLATQQARRDG